MVIFPPGAAYLLLSEHAFDHAGPSDQEVVFPNGAGKALFELNVDPAEPGSDETQNPKADSRAVLKAGLSRAMASNALEKASAANMAFQAASTAQEESEHIEELAASLVPVEEMKRIASEYLAAAQAESRLSLTMSAT